MVRREVGQIIGRWFRGRQGAGKVDSFDVGGRNWAINKPNVLGNRRIVARLRPSQTVMVGKLWAGRNASDGVKG